MWGSPQWQKGAEGGSKRGSKQGGALRGNEELGGDPPDWPAGRTAPSIRPRSSMVPAVCPSYLPPGEAWLCAGTVQTCLLGTHRPLGGVCDSPAVAEETSHVCASVQ